MCSNCDWDYEGPESEQDDDGLRPPDQALQVTLGMVYRHLQRESQMEIDRRATGTIADSQARIARAISGLTELALRRNSEKA